MIRISEKELSVNAKMKFGPRSEVSLEEMFVFDAGWGDSYIDPVTGEKVVFYDHVARHVKFSDGVQLWFLTPRYQCTDGSIFRVLPKNLCEFKHYAAEIIQDALDETLEKTLTENQSAEEKIEGQLNGDSAAEDRPCERTKWLWVLWFYKNHPLIESVLRMINFIRASVSKAGLDTLEAIMNTTDYLLELRTKQPDNWLKIIFQAAWNIGRPLIPLRGIQSIREVMILLNGNPLP